MLGKLVVISAITIFLLSLISYGIFAYLGLYLNVSQSLPIGIYKVSEQDVKSLKKGDYVLACINDKDSLNAFSHGFITSGNCNNKTAPVGKMIVAMALDEVKVTVDSVYVNGYKLKHSKPASKLLSNEHLAKYESYQLKEREYFLLNEKIDSFDSRYLGVFSQEQLIGKIKRVL